MTIRTYEPTKNGGGGRGRPCDLTPEVHKAIVRGLRLGATIKMTTAAAGVGLTTFYEWVAAGRVDLEAGVSSRFADLADDVYQARGHGDIELLASVRHQTQGRRCRTCEGRGTLPSHQAGGRADDQRLVTCAGCKGSGFALSPDGRLALDLLGRRHPDAFGRKSRQRLEVTGDGGGVVKVAVGVAAVAVGLAALTVDQLAALAYDGSEPERVPRLGAALPGGAVAGRAGRDVIDAAEVE